MKYLYWKNSLRKKQDYWSSGTHQHWMKLDRGLKCGQHHYHHHVSCWPWHSAERSIEWIWMGGFILEGMGRYRVGWPHHPAAWPPLRRSQPAETDPRSQHTQSHRGTCCRTTGTPMAAVDTDIEIHVGIHIDTDLMNYHAPSFNRILQKKLF